MTYVIRRRRADGKGWEYEARRGMGSLSTATRHVLSSPPRDKHECLSGCEWARLVPTVRWVVEGGLETRTFDDREVALDSRMPNERILRVTTWRVEPCD